MATDAVSAGLSTQESVSTDNLVGENSNVRYLLLNFEVLRGIDYELRVAHPQLLLQVCVDVVRVIYVKLDHVLVP